VVARALDPRRRLLLAMLAAGLQAVEGRAAVRRALKHTLPPPAPPGSRLAVLAIGKAAPSMLRGAREVLGSRIGPVLVVTTGHAVTPDAGSEWLVASHPVPDARSVAAGHRVLDFLAALPPADPVLLLISGGASSLVEVPRADVSLAEIRALNETGLRSGFDIGRLNAERTRLSAIKGGGLTRALGRRPALALFISDVPGDDPAVIGSGLAGPLDGDGVRRLIAANVEAAMQAAAAQARAWGLAVAVAGTRFSGEAAEVGVQCARRVLDAYTELSVAGGESVVRLPPNPGRGGRNQQLALAAAFEIRGDPERLVMAVGTDGIDGPTEDAGGLVDGQSCQRMARAGLDAATALAGADAGRALEAAGDLVTTGPTGTNVGDLVLALRLSETRAAELLALHGEPPTPVL
jgi:hydroxypyruvate reductase